MEKSLNAEIKKENRLVAEWLLYYPDRLQAYESHIDSVSLYPVQAISEDIRAKGQTSDPTGRIATQLSTHTYDSRWLDVIAEVERRIPDKQRVFLEVRREARNNHANHRGRPAWVVYVQCKYPLVMAEKTGKGAEDFYMHYQTCRYWWDRLIEYAARIAAKRGLLDGR